MDLVFSAITGACRTKSHNGQKQSGYMPRLSQPESVALAFDYIKYLRCMVCLVITIQTIPIIQYIRYIQDPGMPRSALSPEPNLAPKPTADLLPKGCQDPDSHIRNSRYIVLMEYLPCYQITLRQIPLFGDRDFPPQLERSTATSDSCRMITPINVSTTLSSQASQSYKMLSRIWPPFVTSLRQAATLRSIDDLR